MEEQRPDNPQDNARPPAPTDVPLQFDESSLRHVKAESDSSQSHDIRNDSLLDAFLKDSNHGLGVRPAGG
jgi:hypothetical protein